MKNKKIKVLYLAPIKKGGPHLSLKKLSEYYNNNGILEAEFKSSLKDFIFAIFTKKYDIIHTVLPLPFNIWRTPILLNIRGNYKKERGIKNPLGYLYPVSIFFATKIISPSNFLKNILKISRLEVIPNYINLKLNSKKSKIIKSKVNKNSINKIKLLTITGFKFYDKSKGIIKLISILNKLDLNLKIELTIIGDGKYWKEIKSKSFNKDNIEIIWKGYIKDLDIFFENSDIFVYYSNLDTFAIPLVEAQFKKLPVITNKFGAENEIIKENYSGYIAKDDEDYKLKLIKLIKDKNLRINFGNSGYEFVSKNFTIDKISKKFLIEYLSMLK